MMAYNSENLNLNLFTYSLKHVASRSYIYFEIANCIRVASYSSTVRSALSVYFFIMVTPKELNLHQ